MNESQGRESVRRIEANTADIRALSRRVAALEQRGIGTAASGSVSSSTGGNAAVAYVLAPGGGIPARSGTACGTATCGAYLRIDSAGTLADTGTTVTAVNPWPIEVGSNQLVAAEWDGSAWVVTGAFPVAKAKTGGSVIAVASSTRHPTGATVTLCDWNAGTGQWDTNGRTVTGYNPSATATVAANQYVTLNWVAGVWEIVLEPC